MFSLIAAAAAEPPPPVAPNVAPSAMSAWVMPLETSGVIWFTEETRLVETALATELGRRGYTVLPTARQHAAIDRMAARQFPDRDGGCAAMPSAQRWLEQDNAAHHRITSRLSCDTEACTLSVKVFPPGDPGSRERLSVTLPASVTPRAAAAAVSKLKPEGQGGLVGLLGSLGVGFALPQWPVHAGGIETSGRWNGVTDTDERLSALHDRLATCEPPDDAWLDFGVSSTLRLAVGADGHVDRCEPGERHLLAPGAGCRCGVLEDAMVFADGAADRRIAFSLTVAPLVPAPAGTPDRLDRMIELDAYAADDGTAILGNDFLVDRAIRTCLTAPTPEQRWPVTMRVAADGKVTAAKVGAPLDGGDPALAACVEAALVGRQRTCPFGGETTVRANITLAAWSQAEPSPDSAGSWASKLGVKPPYVQYNEVKPEAGGPAVAVLADGTWKDLGRPKVGATLRVYADGGAAGAELLAAIAANRWPGLRRVYVYGEHDQSFRLLVVPPPPGAIGVVAPAPPPDQRPLDIPALPPGVPVVLSLAPRATVATVMELAQRVGERDVVLAGF